MSARRRSKASPSTWLILVLVILVAILSIVSVNSAKNTSKYKKENVKLSKQVEELTPPTGADAISYQKLYPDMMNKFPKIWKKDEKTVYLTFDDGPSAVTPKILDTLKKEKVKATFFVIGKGTDHDMMKRIADEGHAIAIHSYNHDYKNLYASVDSFIEDFHKIFKLVKEKTGKQPDVYRYPGGSNNVFNALLQDEMTAEMFRRGFVPFDWNVDSGDASGHNIAAGTISSNALQGTSMERPIILMHDAAAKGTTAEALPAIIAGYKKAGYDFGVLTNEDAPILFSTPDGARYD